MEAEKTPPSKEDPPTGFPSPEEVRKALASMDDDHTRRPGELPPPVSLHDVY